MAIRLSSINVSPDAFAAVMATGILSTAAKDHQYTSTSNALSVIALLAWAVLVALAVVLATAKRRLLPWGLAELENSLPLFTFVAACAVLCNRLSSAHPLILPVLGAIAGSAWLGLALSSLRNLATQRLTASRDQVHGAWLLFSVATSGLAIVAAKLASSTGHGQWLIAAVVTWVLALAIYIAMTALIVWRAVDERLDREGFQPDTWILMGALAIAVVAGHEIHVQAPNWLAAGVFAIMLTAWAAATLWIPPLIYFGLHRVEQRPKLLRFTGSWWTLVFPLGMYSVAINMIASEANMRSLHTVALVFFWDALLAWSIVAIAGLLRIPRALAGARQ
ncbi:C4-dicarboxylate ABC transporter [Mycobacterium sp. 852002-53434_SCH5985345]|uniref:tellurite resistance/C4-dicarboxylate transporter family protein n=1 Tax=unclassified Mycobacterium TaxID=2642494 RepID=UPI0007FEA129|nr:MULTISPECIES: tellurite resistance/C4-dicarboxylate transporter family protein [unclassified Mycobacterium]OBF50329.1 C4-dicarboxylate ABC transporter [Mycobacterium sp. 852002-53434_SCH5985345]OBF77750.1 C4-dicarboxylate ABC transporter [Mycobacterium sp. 852002-51613_SCH5001154]OBF96536.1 C4-dicarboxylate ABC transporter [Mycobacterium sp. 852014-52450_SCH5900713]